jgi:AraC-like DNA-binding protein
MDDSRTEDDDAEFAAAVFANRYQFAPGERIANRSVESRAFVWGIRGRGVVRSGSHTLELAAGSLALFPWLHDVRYEADRVDPFLVGAVHVIPWHDPGTPIEPRASHGPDDPLAGSASRRDVAWPGGSGLRVASGDVADRLILLGEAAIDFFLDPPVRQSTMRAIGLLMTRAASGLERAGLAGARVSPVLASMQRYVESHLSGPLTTADIAAVARCSTSTAERLFRRGTGRSVQSWVRERRVSEACRLLCSTNLRVGEVGRAVGFSDPLYFSRVFRSVVGVPPSRYVERSRPL